MTAASLSAQLGVGLWPQVLISHKPCGLQPLHLGLGWGPQRTVTGCGPPRGLLVQKDVTEDWGACCKEATPQTRKDSSMATPKHCIQPWLPEQASGPLGARVWLVSKPPLGPPTGGGLKADPAGALSLSLLEDDWEASQTPAGGDRVQLLDLLGRTVGCWPGRGELVALSGCSFPFPVGCGQALGAGDGLAGTAAFLGQACLAGCGLFIRRGLFIYRALAERCQPQAGNSRLPVEGGTQGLTAGSPQQTSTTPGKQSPCPPFPAPPPAAGKQGPHR